MSDPLPGTPKPDYESNGGIHLLKWPSHNVVIRIDRLREHSDAVSGEITIRGSLPGRDSHFHQARLNLTSTTARQQLTKFLGGRYGAGTIPWADMIEQTCVSVLRQYREGKPPVLLRDDPPREALLWRVEPLLVDGQANMIYGAGQSGKSLLAVYLSVLVESSLNHNGLVTEPGKVLYLDYETDEQETADRVRAIQAGLDIGIDTDIIYLYGRGPLADDIERIQRIVLENEVSLVIVDSFGMAAGGDQDKSMDVIRYFQALRTLECTTLTIDHLNKEGHLYGNSYKFNEARCIWEVKAAMYPGMQKIDLGLFHRKMNNGSLHKPIGLRITFAPRKYTVALQNITQVEELAKPIPLRFRIKAALERGAISIEEIVERLPDAKYNSVKTILSRNKQLFQPVYVEGVRDHLWGLVSQHEQP